MIFVRQGLSFSELSTSSLSSLDSYSNYASSILSSPTDSITDSFTLSILSSSTNFFILGDFNCYHPIWNSKGTSDYRGRKYSSGSSPLNSFPAMTLTYLLFSVAPLTVVPPLISPFFLPFLALSFS